jgi:glycine/D-amino acid oxidase-like deaminating enzyme
LIGWTDEAEIGRPYWWDRDSEPVSDELDATSVDVLVVGAGYTGLSAAIAARDAGASVAVVDAGTPGQGASTRNGGMFGAHPRLGWRALSKAFGPDMADALFAEANPALNFVKNLIQGNTVECDLQQTGRIQLAWTKRHFEGQKALASDVGGKSDVDIRIVDKADLGAEIATDRYAGGILFPEHCAINPRKFSDGLKDAARRRGVPVVANTPVVGITRNGAKFTVQTTGTPITAEKVILATNGYTPAAFRWHQRRVFPLPSYLIATEELPPDLIAELAPGKRMMVETRARHSYFRISPDGKRILFGGRASMRDIPLQLAAQRLHQTMCEVWPSLSATRLSHVWTGNTGYSFSHMPTVGEHDGIHYAMGYSGSGTVMAPYLGAKAAWQALGDPRGATAYSQTKFRPSLLHPFQRPHFLRAADVWYRNWIDPQENRAARRD